MAKIRNIAFGYMIKDGEVMLNPKESDAVKIIFSQYLSGFSFKKIAEHMTVPYRENASAWNKNMVKRILECPKYIGGNGYPQIISADDFENVKTLIGAKTTYKPKPKVTQETEKVPLIFNYVPNLTVTRLVNEIGREIEKRDADKQNIKSLILQCAAERYNCCGAERGYDVG